MSERPDDPLQEFVSAVSHDFGRPLRHIVAFAGLLLDKHSADLDTESTEWLTYLRRAGEEANLMLERLLAYSRLATAELNPAEVDLAELCQKVLRELGEQHSDTARVKVRAEGCITTNSELLRQLLVELVDNALCYGGDAQIHLSALADDSGASFSIRDDGPGMPDEKLGSALRPFGRLQPEDPAHVGLGLSLCTRILELLDSDLRFETEGDGLEVLFELRNLQPLHHPAEASAASGMVYRSRQ